MGGVKRLFLAALPLCACAALRAKPAPDLSRCTAVGRIVYDPRNAPVFETQTAGPSHVMGGDPEPVIRGHFTESGGRIYRCPERG